MSLLVKYNKKTVTIITESVQQWNISPHLLSKVKSVKDNKQGKLIDLFTDQRNYNLIEEIHTLPSVGYLTKVRNREEESNKA